MTACLFDIDGTLISSLGAGKAALEAALLGTFGLPRVLVNVPYSGRTDTAITTDLLRHHGIEPSHEHRTRLQDAYLRYLPQSLRQRQGKLLPGIGSLLQMLKAREHCSLGLLTGNLRRGAAIKLGHFGIDHYFSFGGYGDDHVCRDEVARAALASTHAHLGRMPLDVWVIGDTPLDVKCARAIGAKVLAVATGLHPVEELADHRPDLLLPDLADPEPFLRLLH